MWDMMSRNLHVLDPLIRGGGPSEATKDKHELIAWKLHHALFHCLNEYYAGWPTQDGQWASKYPVVAEENFDRYVLIFSPKSTGTFIIFLLAHIIFPFFPFFSITKQTRNWRLRAPHRPTLRWPEAQDPSNKGRAILINTAPLLLFFRIHAKSLKMAHVCFPCCV